MLAAILGKFGACWWAARRGGASQAEAARLGALMNARGLMQLIALNVGLQAGIVNGELFTALVLVALITTLMAAPALTLLDRRMPLPPEPAAAGPESVAAGPESVAAAAADALPRRWGRVEGH